MKILDALASHGANLNCVVGEEKETPLHKACATGNDDITLWLLKNGANPNLRHVRTGATPLMFAAKYAFPECVAHMIKYQAKMDARDVSEDTHVC
jgi:ankyrin repeat protein